MCENESPVPNAYMRAISALKVDAFPSRPISSHIDQTAYILGEMTDIDVEAVMKAFMETKGIDERPKGFTDRHE